MKALIEKYGSMTEMAQSLGVTHETVRLWKVNEDKRPNILKHINKIKKDTGLSTDEIIKMIGF